MDFKATTTLTAAPGAAWEMVTDLGTYPRWLGIVSTAEPDGAHPDDPGPAWSIVLQARLGPLSRRKRLRMVRVVADALPGDAGGSVRFERMEHDAPQHL